MALASAAQAQTSTSTETLLGDDVDSGFLIAPDFKLTEIDGDFASLGGAYGGWVLDRKLLLGGGVYTLLQGRDGAEMTYGGGVVEYFVNPTKAVNFSFRGLIGGGSATLGGPHRGDDFDREDFDGPGLGRGPGNGFARPFGRFPGGDFEASDRKLSSSFFIAEPEANVNLNLTKLLRLGFGGGYRFITGARGLDERLGGLFASVALKLSFF
jgi:hypothetical protein